MSDREPYKLYSMICIPDEQDEISGIYDEIIKNLSTSLSNKVLDIIQDGKEYITSMGEVVQEEADGIVQYKMRLDMKPLIRCKDCKYGSKCLMDMIQCKVYEILHCVDWFCASGERRDDAVN